MSPCNDGPFEAKIPAACIYLWPWGAPATHAPSPRAMRHTGESAEGVGKPAGDSVRPWWTLRGLGWGSVRPFCSGVPAQPGPPGPNSQQRRSSRPRRLMKSLQIGESATVARRWPTFSHTRVLTDRLPAQARKATRDNHAGRASTTLPTPRGSSARARFAWVSTRRERLAVDSAQLEHDDPPRGPPRGSWCESYGSRTRTRRRPMAPRFGCEYADGAWRAYALEVTPT